MHQHDEYCGCDHGRHHHQGEHCHCGHEHAAMPVREGISPVQVDILLALRQRHCLPVASFALLKKGDEDRYMVALAPVYLATTEDTMEQVKDLGKVLSELENMDLIFLDYDIPIANYAYAEYKNSALYAYFVQTTEEAARRPNPAFDTPDLELGSITLTEKGENWVDEMLKGGK